MSAPAPVQVGAVRPLLGRLRVAEAAELLGGLVAVNVSQLRRGVPGISRALHEKRVRYQRTDPLEHWRTLEEVWRFGGGDCEDLAAAVAAERTVRGMPSRVVLYRARPQLWHAVVQDLTTGRLLDPSRTGGML